MASLFGTAYSHVDEQLNLFLHERLARVVSEVDGPLRIAITLYVVLYGLCVLRGAVSEPVMEGVTRLVKLAFVYVVGTTVAYDEWVTQPLFVNLPDALAHAVSGGSVDGVGQAFDEFLGRGFSLATECGKSASIVDPLPWITATLTYAATAIMAALGFGITIVAKVALAMLVAVGPIFVACLVFEPTRRFFYGWISQGVNYLVLFVLIVTVFQIVLSIIDQQWAGIMAQPDPQVAGLMFVTLCALGSIFFLQVPNIASGIAGGAVAGLRDFGRTGGWAQSQLQKVSLPRPPAAGPRSGGSVAALAPRASTRAL